MRDGEWATTVVFLPLGFFSTLAPPAKRTHSPREKQETTRSLRYQLFYYPAGSSPGAQPPGPVALLFLVDGFMGCQAHLDHQDHKLLEVNSTILIDIQLFEPGVCVLLLSRLRRKKPECKGLRECWGMAVCMGPGDPWPGDHQSPTETPSRTRPLLTCRK